MKHNYFFGGWGANPLRGEDWWHNCKYKRGLLVKTDRDKCALCGKERPDGNEDVPKVRGTKAKDK